MKDSSHEKNSPRNPQPGMVVQKSQAVRRMGPDEAGNLEASQRKESGKEEIKVKNIVPVKGCDKARMTVDPVKTILKISGEGQVQGWKGTGEEKKKTFRGPLVFDLYQEGKQDQRRQKDVRKMELHDPKKGKTHQGIGPRERN